MIARAVKFEIHMASQQAGGQAKVDAAVLSLKAGSPDSFPVLQSGSRILSSLRDLKRNMFALKSFNGLEETHLHYGG